MPMKTYFAKLILATLVLSIFYFERTNLGLRYEDFAFLLLSPFVMVALFVLFSTFKFIFLYYVAITLTTLSSIWFGVLDPKGIFILGKEFQYAFLFFLSFQVSKRTKNSSFVCFLFLSVLLGNICYGILKLLSNERAYYGIASINELSSPSLTAWTYFGCALLYFIACGNNRIKFPNRMLVLIAAFCSFLTGSRTGLLITLLFIIYLITTSKKYFKTIIFVSILGLTFSSLLFKNELFGLIVNRYTAYDRYIYSASHRQNNWNVLHSTKDFNFFEKIVGKGRGYSNMKYDSYLKVKKWDKMTLNVDNMYVRNLEEIGWLGQLFFIIMLLSFFSRIDVQYYKLYSAILLIYLTSSITMESFLLSKSASIYWLSTGLLIGLSIKRSVVQLRNK